MSDKQSFIIYKSFYEPIKDLKDEDLGKLFRAIYQYQITNEIPNLDANLKMAFMFFKNQFDVDDDKYERIVERNKLNGAKGGRPSKTEKTHSVISQPKKPDNDNENDIDNDIFITLLTKDKGEYPITNDIVEKFQKTYPYTNVMQELNKMSSWLLANTNKRKTSRGMLRFVNNWLSRQDEKRDKPQTYNEMGKVIRKEQEQRTKILTLEDLRKFREEAETKRRIENVHTTH